ncbi:hypothetical protein N657DRAFT_685438 [Parathielavia appendiculata]|uniref:Uncharacterized protein n=1 Tax=Parathielavia appendiculata TaxID=2587402 RepID=A0AAN6TPD5_9PEZI|nr:hypothetical protein N657DRAFT_685438 [Parathielavia appendiculata]
MLWSDYSDVPTDDGRRCQVVGCHKKHAYSKNEVGQRIYSKYCSDHTCAKRYPEEDGYHCATPRARGERYCPDHLKCGEPGCEAMGEFVGTRDYIRWFCIRHRCSAPDCRLRASDKQQRRCASHFMSCTVPGCTRPAHLHRSGRLDLVCAVHYDTHRCLVADCTRWASSSARYCPSHKCAVPDCSAARRSLSVPNGGGACLRHLCTTPYCTNPVLYPNRARSVHCALHTCKTASCVNPRAASSSSSSGGITSDFCLSHTCLTPGCRAEARFAGSHCERHVCVVAGCANPRLSAVPSSTLGVGLDRERCASHTSRRERRAASLDVDGFGMDWEGLRGRFGGSGEREMDRERKRLSDDLERLRRRERELEAERWWAADRSREAGLVADEDLPEPEREGIERIQRDLDSWKWRYS